jgi:signal transduction histidine kinase
MSGLKTLRFTAILLFLLSLGLAVIMVERLSQTRRWLSRANYAMNGYTLAERSIELDLLNERSGRFRNYDQINAHLNAARSNLAILGQSDSRNLTHDTVAELVAITDQQEKLIERFNADNALLRNSLAYMRAGGAPAPQFQDLSNRILKLTLDTSPTTVAKAKHDLRQMPLQPAGAPAARFLFHARVLVEVLPEIDDLLAFFRKLRMEDRLSGLQDAVRQESKLEIEHVLRMEAALAGSILLWLASMAALILLMRGRYRDLRIQAANERLSAAIAVPLIDTGRDTFVTRVEEAAVRLAAHVGARRLQLLIPATGDAAHYSKSQDEGDSQWLSRMVDAADADGAWANNRIAVSLSDERAHLTSAMREVGIGHLVLLRTVEPLEVVLGFEPDNFAVAERRDYLAGLSSAIVAVAHGARREIDEQHRERLEQSLAHKTRVEKIGAIASGVAHNFNNIIGAIGGFAEMGQDCTRKGTKSRRNFDEIELVVERGRHLIDDILSFAKQRRAGKATRDLCALLSPCIKMLSAASRRETSFELSAPPEPIFVRCSENDLQQALVNICNNAAEAGTRQPVRVRIYRAELTQKAQLSHGRLPPGYYAVVSISDSGPGISPQLRDRLFEPFVTTKANGTGLGLSTAWDIVQSHGGTIHVENKADGGGAVFSVWLPEVTDMNETKFGDGGRSQDLSRANSVFG